MSVRAFGVTGAMGTGKSTLATALAAEGRCVVVEVDDLRRVALRSPEARHVAMRLAVAEALGLRTVGAEAWIEADVLRRATFASFETIAAFGKASAPTLRADLASVALSAPRPVAVAWTLLVDDGYAQDIDGPLLVTACPSDVARRRVLLGDDLPRGETERRLALLPTGDAILASAMDARPDVVVVDTSRESLSADDMDTVRERLDGTDR